MNEKILLYGATGYSGRLIAAEAARERARGNLHARVALGGRASGEVTKLARELDFEPVVFGLDDSAEVYRHLKGTTVLLNAAGPFAWTAERLAKSAIEVGCHYVDINGEVDVYKRLDDLARSAANRELTMVCSAGHMAATSDLMLDAALEEIKRREIDRVGDIRIALSRITAPSRGSRGTVLRSMREQVVVLRDGKGIRRWEGNGPVLWHVAAGYLEATFEFGPRPSGPRVRPELAIASAVNLVDTLTARQELIRHKVTVRQVASYVETTPMDRLGLQFGAMAAPLIAAMTARGAPPAVLSALPPGPTTEERRRTPHAVILQIEDERREPMIDWQLATPNIYDLTAQTALAVTRALTRDKALPGWRTPAEVVGRSLDLTQPAQRGVLRNCRFESRLPARA